jgi:hypothetical protein
MPHAGPVNREHVATLASKIRRDVQRRILNDDDPDINTTQAREAIADQLTEREQ